MRGFISIKAIEFVLSILLVWGLVTYVHVFISLASASIWILVALGGEGAGCCVVDAEAEEKTV